MITGDTAPVGRRRRGGARRRPARPRGDVLRRRAERARETLHSTARGAPRRRAEAEVELLALTHLSSRYGGREVAARGARGLPRDGRSAGLRRHRGAVPSGGRRSSSRAGHSSDPAGSRIIELRNDAPGSGRAGGRRHRGGGAPEILRLAGYRARSSRPRARSERATTRSRCSSPESSLEDAQDAIEAMTEPDEFVDEQLRTSGGSPASTTAPAGRRQLVGALRAARRRGRPARPARARRRLRHRPCSRPRSPSGRRKVWGVDPSAEMLAVARGRRAGGVGLEAGRRRGAALSATAGSTGRDAARRAPRRPAAAFAEAARVLAGGSGARDVRPALPTYWLTRSSRRSQRSTGPLPDGEQLERGARAAGFGRRLVRLSQRGRITREQALARIRGRHISTFDLLDEDEIARGTERAERELPERVEYALEWLVSSRPLDVPGAVAHDGHAPARLFVIPVTSTSSEPIMKSMCNVARVDALDIGGMRRPGSSTRRRAQGGSPRSRRGAAS